MEEEPRIKFKALKGFPPVEQKLETETFLEAAKEVVTVIESFGRLFSPVFNDMNGNILKLTKTYDQDRVKYQYLEDMILISLKTSKYAADALLWLKRGLQLICLFFENIYNDVQNGEVLKKHLQSAYDRTLKPYHGFLVQGTIKIIYNWVPTRSQLIGRGEAHDENIKVLQTYLPTMRYHLTCLDSLLKKCNMEDANAIS